MTDVSDRYRKVAQDLTTRVESVPGDRWGSPSPCAEWKARDVLNHVIDTHHMFFGFVDHQVPRTKSVDDDPLGAWTEARDAMQAALDDPTIAKREFDGPMGRSMFEESIARIGVNDVLIHTWDLARATGTDERLDPDAVRRASEGLSALGDNVRRPGVFGPAVELPDGASEQDRFLAFTGRDPR